MNIFFDYFFNGIEFDFILDIKYFLNFGKNDLIIIFISFIWYMYI